MSNINDIVNKLSKKFEFDQKEAMDFLGAFVAEVAERESVASSSGTKTKLSPIEQCRKNIALWEKKQTANKFKDDEAKNKHAEKLQKEKTKLAKLEGVKVIATEPAPASKTAAKAEVKPAEEKPSKVISRMSPTLKTALRKALTAAGQTFTDDEWKGSKKPDEFKNYVNSLAPEVEKAKGIDKHMEDFAGSSTAAEVQPAATEPESSEPVVLTTKELRAIKKLTTTSTPGQFWDGDKGRFVTGPAENTSEDMVELKIKTQVPHGGAGSDKPKFEMLDHVVGEKTKRLYRCGEDDAADQFVGYIGIGEFKDVEDPTL
jgi:hypothetical protein